MKIEAESKFNIGDNAVWMVDWYNDEELNKVEVKITAITVMTDGKSISIYYDIDTGDCIEHDVSEIKLIKY